MADFEEVRRLVFELPDTTEATSWGSAHWRVHDKGFVWDRPLRAKELAHLDLAEQSEPVLGARVEDVATKLALIEEDPLVFFTTPHFTDYAAVLVWLDRISQRRLEELVTDAWLTVAPVKLAKSWLAEHTD